MRDEENWDATVTHARFETIALLFVATLNKVAQITHGYTHVIAEVYP